MDPSCQERKSRQHVGAHCQVGGVVVRNVNDNAQVGGDNTQFVNYGKFCFSKCTVILFI